MIGACLAFAGLAGVACRDLTSLQQSNPGALDASTVFIPANATLLTNGAIADFECAFSRYVVGSGLWRLSLGGVFLLALDRWSRSALPRHLDSGQRALLSLLVLPLAATTILSGQMGAGAVLLVGLAHGFAAGQLVRLLVRKSIVALSLTLFTAGLEYRRKYKEADSGAVCPPSTTQCKTGAVGAPTRTELDAAVLSKRGAEFVARRS